jgi:hypothetical protein
MAEGTKPQLDEFFKCGRYKMDKETLEKLIADQPRDVRAKGVLLFNGAAQCAQAYQSAPTAANLRDWEVAQAALTKFADQLGDKEDADKPLATLADVLEYLKEAGWKVTKTSLYRQQKEGKLLPRADGAYTIKSVEKYARTWLKQQSTGKRISEKMDDLQRQKLELELSNLLLENKRKELSFNKEMEKLVPREQMEIELATRAGVLEAGLKHWIQSRTAEWVRLVAGDIKKVGALINVMSRDLDKHINSYAIAPEYQVVIDAAEEAGLEESPESVTEPTADSEV